MTSSIVRFTVVILANIFLLSSCYIKSAESPTQKTLVIASDFLSAKDTLLFTDFSKKHGVQLEIRPMTTDAIIGLMRNTDYNSGLDLILSESSHSAFRLSNERLTQKISKDDDEFDFEHTFISSKYSYVALGIDPFVIYYDSDSSINARTYQDLFKTPHYHSLNRDDLLAFLSPLRGQKNQVETYNWVEDWFNLAVEYQDSNSRLDSLRGHLIRYSHLTPDQIEQGTTYFPDGLRRGTYNAISTMAIVKQAENFVTARLFIQHYSNPGNNSIINDKLRTFPLYDYLPARKGEFQLNPVSNETLLQYHPMLDRILNKLE
ncbi:MAG: ABC-type thiamine transport system substrate-binding protein [Flavobacteriaceae bacterium]|jgi:ABC-type thiamine transport system substrate-binding protein